MSDKKEVPKLSEQIIRQLKLNDDLNNLEDSQLVQYYDHMCAVMGLEPETLPLGFISSRGKLTLYAGKKACAQIRSRHNISCRILEVITSKDIYTVRVQTLLPNGRMDEDIGSVFVGKLFGDNLANKQMHAVTKGKNRSTLSIKGIDLLDETEINFEGAERMSLEEVLNKKTPADSITTPVVDVVAPEPFTERDVEQDDPADDLNQDGGNSNGMTYGQYLDDGMKLREVTAGDLSEALTTPKTKISILHIAKVISGIKPPFKQPNNSKISHLLNVPVTTLNQLSERWTSND